MTDSVFFKFLARLMMPVLLLFRWYCCCEGITNQAVAL
jgi:hypothetical protein